MSTPPTPLPMVEVPGAEAPRLLEGRAPGRPAYTRRDLTVIRPGRMTWTYGRLVVRTPAPAVAVPTTATYHVDEVRAATGIGWTVSVAGSVDVITDPDDTAHYQRTLSGWSHGPHDTLLRLHPETVTGFRLARAET
ncbi:pyridoxamine 5'-phosphate oxidase family protein [Streptomyces sp. DSM 40750]|uniref:pyridoxamine 5'-phosphate oxidase family protein n=1 Tax=Streptomyces sp. DSM 40750 TaxID=2801030 RepID=UPI00214CD287|nr:pyridoxamine 5'-phosphate oxidase family protein [Streptomyces sp. DSM 40750]UUU19013.1 pyridoxamine 5'-phosphate oxidase family protein [Streptomyces sp. DSM 40750]UUU27645.1 pyridoxamine 5'-phosphate oxidase family protein [Streptomyces sp. DSM 40750]